MSLYRSHRNDRRRRVIRESIATDSDFAVESVRAQRKARRASLEERSESMLSGYRDPGYSHAVRKTCQQRLVQLIPIRAGSLATALSVMWAIWAGLLLAHYLFHVRGTASGRSPIPLLQVFDIRSPHSIANWMTCQLWMLTGIVAWMIFRIRQHKLDDYRARYRIWGLLACVALFSSFDAATSVLYLFGQTIDPWTRREIGYGGWPLVLACYASLVALMGLRLSSELKGTPTAVALWFGGLLAWACAALLGTGLLKLNWQPGTLDLIVGGCWLGGVLLVFQAAGMYLRHCYLQAQKRFLERAVPKSSSLRLSLPSVPRMPWSRSQSLDAATGDDEDDEDRDASGDDDILDTIPKKSWLPWRRSVQGAESPEGSDRSAKKSDAPSASAAEPRRPIRLFGLIPSRVESNEILPDEPIAQDDGGPIDEGLTKKPGWFGIGGHKRSETAKPTPSATKSKSSSAQGDRPAQETKKDDSTPRRSWLPNLRRPKESVAASSTKPSSPSQPEPARKAARGSWIPWRKPSGESSSAKPSAPSEPKPKKQKLVSAPSPQRVRQVAEKIYGWFDGLRLKPPVDNTPAARSATSTNAPTPAPSKPGATSNVPFPSTSAKPAPPASNDEDDDENASDYRQLSKAERKRLRRQQGNDRYAA